MDYFGEEDFDPQRFLDTPVTPIGPSRGQGLQTQRKMIDVVGMQVAQSACLPLKSVNVQQTFVNNYQ